MKITVVSNVCGLEAHEYRGWDHLVEARMLRGTDTDALEATVDVVGRLIQTLWEKEILFTEDASKIIGLHDYEQIVIK